MVNCPTLSIALLRFVSAPLPLTDELYFDSVAFLPPSSLEGFGGADDIYRIPKYTFSCRGKPSLMPEFA